LRVENRALKGLNMPKTKTKRGRAADRRRIASGQPYEVNYFARKHGLTAAEAREIIKQARGNREKANQLAEKKKR
jgi:Protein of unknown function (DUF3606)